MNALDNTPNNLWLRGESTGFESLRVEKHAPWELSRNNDPIQSFEQKAAKIAQNQEMKPLAALAIFCSISEVNFAEVLSGRVSFASMANR